ncbi:MAG: DUF5916 domain-containing protein [candidate division Zixibacteria bacterium]|jgi:hypothetical protein|nr:DUF5916 domain-containing protein [candidate division Zixibacteria bacterium]
MLWLAALASDDQLSYRVTTVTAAPEIDGLLDLCWRTGDSVTSFVQVTPDEGLPLSEPTTVYILQDSRALYIAFKCKTPNRYPDCRRETRESRSGDEVSLFLDTFFDRQTAYRFTVSCGNVQSDAVLSANGREENITWDGVFESAVYVDTGIFIVEMAIPWSSLQFDKGAPAWGFNLERKIPKQGEVGYAVPVKQNEALSVSGFGRLEGVAPADRNLGLELAPTTFFRAEKSYNERSDRVRVGADINWALTPAVRLQTTFYPDFAQVEADPFALNLSKYAIYFSEKRPFFVEGQEFFDPPGGAMAGLLTLFYSRSIGKKLPDGTEVPIQAGGRLVGKLPRVEFGTLLARTGSEDYEGWYGPETQQAATFAVNRVTVHPTPGTTVGLFQAGEYEQDHHNDVYSVDAGLSNALLDVYGQVARSRYDDYNDWAWLGSFHYTPRGLSLRADAVSIGYDFDVSDIGFVPWYDYRSYAASAGPTVYPSSGLLTYGKIAFGTQFDREYGESIYASRYSINLALAMRCNWGAGLTYAWGRDFEQDMRYDPRSWSGFLRSDVSRRAWFIVNVSTSRSFNYLRYYLARSWNIDWYASFKPQSAMSVFFNGDAWIENDPGGSVEEITWRFRPGCSYSVTRDISMRAYGESTVYRSVGIRSVRVGLSLAYNFLPKSWLYLAYNDYQRRRDDHTYQPLEQVFVMKVRYLVSM